MLSSRKGKQVPFLINYLKKYNLLVQDQSTIGFPKVPIADTSKGGDIWQTLRASPAVLRMWSCIVKLDEEKVKICRFGSAKLHTLGGLVKGAAMLHTSRKESVIYMIW